MAIFDMFLQAMPRQKLPRLSQIFSPRGADLRISDMFRCWVCRSKSVMSRPINISMGYQDRSPTPTRLHSIRVRFNINFLLFPFSLFLLGDCYDEEDLTSAEISAALLQEVPSSGVAVVGAASPGAMDVSSSRGDQMSMGCSSSRVNPRVESKGVQGADDDDDDGSSGDLMEDTVLADEDDDNIVSRSAAARSDVQPTLVVEEAIKTSSSSADTTRTLKAANSGKDDDDDGDPDVTTMSAAALLAGHEMKLEEAMQLSESECKRGSITTTTTTT